LPQDYGALTERQTALIMYEALQTVAACHQARIYHGDVKPANFMLANPLPEHSIQGELEKCVLSLVAPVAWFLLLVSYLCYRAEVQQS
jgi:serine/threonine protein kinase